MEARFDFKLKSALCAVVLTSLLLFACRSEDDSLSRTGGLVFSYELAEDSQNGRVRSEAAKKVSYVLEGKDGSILNGKLALTEINGGYVSEPISVGVGEYKLVHYLILDEDDETVYAAPQVGSLLAKYVERPLPISFTVTENSTTSLTPEVLAVNDYTPMNFGYAEFNLNQVDVAILMLPLDHYKFDVVKVEYELTKGTSVMKGQMTDGDYRVIDFDPSLVGTTWGLTLSYWLRKPVDDCVQKIYRFSRPVTFSGNLIQIPSAQASPGLWEVFLFNESDGYKFFRSADPKKEFKFEVYLPNGLEAHGYVDICFKADGSPTCDCSHWEGASVGGVLKGNMPIDLSCMPAGASVYTAESLSTFAMVGQQSLHQIHFSWRFQANAIETFCEGLPAGSVSSAGEN